MTTCHWSGGSGQDEDAERASSPGRCPYCHGTSEEQDEETESAEQLSLEDAWIEDQRKAERLKPAKQQIVSADVVMFTGTHGVHEYGGTGYKKNLQKGTLGFVNGWRSGVYNAHLTTRRESLWVCSLDLKPMRVSDF